MIINMGSIFTMVALALLSIWSSITLVNIVGRPRALAIEETIFIETTVLTVAHTTRCVPTTISFCKDDTTCDAHNLPFQNTMEDLSIRTPTTKALVQALSGQTDEDGHTQIAASSKRSGFLEEFHKCHEGAKKIEIIIKVLRDLGVQDKDDLEAIDPQTLVDFCQPPKFSPIAALHTRRFLRVVAVICTILTQCQCLHRHF